MEHAPENNRIFLDWLKNKIQKKIGEHPTNEALAEFLYSETSTVAKWSSEKSQIPKLPIHFLCYKFGLDWDDVEKKGKKLLDYWCDRKEEIKSAASQFSEIRKSKSYKQNEIADIFNVTKQLISLWENGRCKIPEERMEQLKNLEGK